MSQLVPEDQLATELSPFTAVEAAYPAELSRAHEALMRGLPVMIECDKELTPYFYRCLRDRLSKDKRQCVYLDGRIPPEQQGPMGPQGLIATMIAQLRNVVRGSVEARVVVLPHLDLLTSASGGLTAEAREVIPLLYENPEMLWLGFRDPSFPVPKVIENLFPHKESILGVGRERLRYLVTQREARKFGKGFNPYLLYKHVSGVNAVRLRRLLAAVTGEDYPADPKPALRQLRQATLVGSLSIPDLDLRNDVGGYPKVKEQLETEIIRVLETKDGLSDPEAIKRIEALLPRGIIFWGPPGTGKTFFAKAMARSLGAAVTVVSGPELKSRWVGESEENLRQIFVRARQSAPALIIFDELDSFASARGTYTGSGVEHSMVNQLLTEMDGFRKEELVFVVGTTNLVEMIDPALLRPGRFEFQVAIPYPDSSDRRAIFEIHARNLGLTFSDAALDFAVERTGDFVETTGTLYSGDHIQALCRNLARFRLRKPSQAAIDVAEVDAAFERYLERPQLTSHEETIVATHECGHAVVATILGSRPGSNVPHITRISIRGDLSGTLGFVRYADPAHRHVATFGELKDFICMLFGGREAERLLCDDLSIGSSSDLERATRVARQVVEQFGFGEGDLKNRRFLDLDPLYPSAILSERTRELIDAEIQRILRTESERARIIIQDNKSLLEVLRKDLLQKKILRGPEIAIHTKPGNAAQ